MVNDLQAWQRERQAELAAPSSWLGLIGLFWLQPGINRVGSTEESEVVLPAGLPEQGKILWEAGEAVWQPAEGPEQILKTDLDGAPTVVDIGHLSFFVVDREGQLAVRLRDREWAQRAPFAGLAYFPFAADWVVDAAWEAIDPPLVMEVPNVSGDLKTVSVSHRAVFEHAGDAVALLPMSVGENEVFFVFRDRTSGKESYGAGRFLKAPVPENGRIRLDFNRAYNPPCAFTPFATCPLPPPENWLSFEVRAGEKKYAGKA